MDIDHIAQRITGTPRVISESSGYDDILVLLATAELHLISSAFEVNTTTWDDPGDYPSAAGSRSLPSYDYVEEIYGGAEFELMIPVAKLQQWRIDYEPTQVTRYPTRGRATRQESNVGVLIIGATRIDSELLNEALADRIFDMRDELDIEIPDGMDTNYSLTIKWADWRNADDQLICRIGIEADIT